jgi:hypothetical protein
MVLVAALAFCINVFLAIDRHSHSVSDTLYGVFPFFACTFLLVDWIAGRTSQALPQGSIGDSPSFGTGASRPSR